MAAAEKVISLSSLVARLKLFQCIIILSLLFCSPTARASSVASSAVSSIAKSTTLTEENNMTSELMSTTYKRIVFSDVDGTLAHYPANVQKGGPGASVDDTIDATAEDGLIYLPPSKTGTRGVISIRTLKLCYRIRYGIDAPAPAANNKNDEVEETGALKLLSSERRIGNGGVPFVLISGMRTTTLFQRLPYLPRADAYVSESGGRIFYPHPIPKDGVDVTGNDLMYDGLVKGLVVQPMSYPGIAPADAAPFSLVEDMHWKNRLSESNAAGNDGYDDEFPVQQRRGKLWEFARTLLKRGYVLDTSGYATAFRVNRKQQTLSEHESSEFNDFLEKCSKKEGVPEGLECATNLGCVDFYPTMSGKKNCAEYLAKRLLRHSGDELITLKTHAFCLCDDDNDIDMALACCAAYLPSVTSESIRDIVRSPQTSRGGNLVITEDADGGITDTLATEVALEAIINSLA